MVKPFDYTLENMKNPKPTCTGIAFNSFLSFKSWKLWPTIFHQAQELAERLCVHLLPTYQIGIPQCSDLLNLDGFEINNKINMFTVNAFRICSLETRANQAG